MPPPLHPVVTRRAQELWELQDLRGDGLIAQMSRELLDAREGWTQNLPEADKTHLPSDRSTLNKMAARLGWKTSEEQAGGTDKGPISGITDPIWHLSNIMGRKKAREYTHQPCELRNAEVDQIVFSICMDVAEAYRPHQKMFKKFRPLVRKWVIQEKKANEDSEKEAIEVQSQISAMAEAGLMTEIRGQGLPIDETHAGLEIVRIVKADRDIPEELKALMPQGEHPLLKEEDNV